MRKIPKDKALDMFLIWVVDSDFIAAAAGFYDLIVIWIDTLFLAIFFPLNWLTQ